MNNTIWSSRLGALGAVLCLFSLGFSAETVVLSPERAVELAQTRSVPVKISAYTLKGEEYARRGALAPFLPSINANAGATHLNEQPLLRGNKVPGIDSLANDSMGMGLPEPLQELLNSFSQPQPLGPQNIYTAGITVSQPLFTGGRLVNGYRIARLRHEAQLFTHNRTITESGFNGLQLFWNYVLVSAQTKALAESVQWLEKLVADQNQKVEAGAIIELDLLRTKTQLSQSRLQLLRANNSVQTIAEQLLNFLKLPLDARIQVDTAGAGAALERFVPPQKDSVDTWIFYREDLQARKRQVEMLRAAKRLQVGSYLPVLSAFYTYNLSNQYSPEESQLEPNQSVGISLNWALWDWGQAYRKYQQTALQEKAARLGKEALVEQIRLRIHELARRVQENKQAVNIAAEGLATARRGLEIAELQYESEMITQTDLLQTRSAMTQAHVQYETAKVEAILALEEYKIAPINSAPVKLGGAPIPESMVPTKDTSAPWKRVESIAPIGSMQGQMRQ